MNLWTKKVIAGILLVNMLVGIAPTLNVYGFEHQPEETKLEQSVDVVSIDEEYSKNKEEKLIEKQGRVANESEKEGAFNDSDKEIAQVGENSESEIRYGEINFVYIENPYVQTPNIQRIVFSFDQEITGAEKVALIVENEKGNQEEWQLTKQSGSLYLFEKEYEQGTLGGVYKVVKLVLKNHIEEKIVVLDDINVKAEFGVDASYEGIEELKPLEGQLSENQSGVEASIVTIDEEGTTQAQNNIAEALKVVSTERANAIGTREQPLESKSENIVVALDPGHDANDAGAQGHGLKEEDLTLKIANYCKQELEQYAGVTVYMTRTGAACPYNKPGITCMEDRVNAAVNAGAKIFVSFHLNSSVSSAVKGAEVIVPNNSWKAEVGAAGRELGEAILDELVALGLTRRSVYSKDTTINERYPDGSISDYFSVQIHCKEHGIPGLIVEHAFLSNSSDVNNFLKTESGLKKLGIADATGIAKYLGLVKGYWEKVGDGYKFNIGSGKYLKQQWLFVNGKWYYLDADGYRVTGWKDIGIYRYFFNPQGEMHTGWYSEKSVWYYFGPSGNMYTGWLKENNKWYYYDSLNGKMVKGWAKIGQFWYYFDKAGKMLTGWQNIGIFKYYFGPSGNMYIGWQEIAGKKYYFGPSGNMYTGWKEFDGHVYYFDENGVLNEEKKPHAITGASAVTINEMETLFEKSGKKYPGKELGKGGAPDIRTFCRIYFEEAEMEGIKAEVAFAQAMLETGYLQYGKDVKIEQFNFAGLGATGNGATGESFPDVRTGIRAHIQHLQAYSSKTPLKNQLVDNRYKYVKRGCAPYVEWLGIQENPEGKGWATAKRYGESIMNILKKM